MWCVVISRAAAGMVASGPMVMAGEVVGTAGRQPHVRLLAQVPAAAHEAGHPGLPAGLVLGGEQIGLGDDAHHLAAHLQHGHAADPVPGQQAVDFLVGRDPVHGHAPWWSSRR